MKTPFPRSRRLVALVAALLIAGCASPSYFVPRTAPDTPAAFKQADDRSPAASAPAAAPDDRWWAAFADPVLDALVQRADRDNAGIQGAAARLAQARAVLRSAEAQRLPQAGLGAQATRGNLATPGAATPTTGLGVGASVSWEPDLFGRLATASRAASLDARAGEALLRSARLLVQSEVAQTYFALRAVDDERALVRETVAAYADTLSLTERRYQAGEIAELDLARVQMDVAVTEAQALDLDRRRALLEHGLAVLVGEPASSFTLSEAAWHPALPNVPPGLPSTMLTRRPDVQAALDGWRAAQERVGAAHSAWFPDFSLTASGGYASSELRDVLTWSARSWGVGALLSLPLFDGGRRDAAVARAQAVWDEAAATYRGQVLAALRDVEDQLAALRLLSAQSGAQQQAVDAAVRATRLSNARYRNGYVSQLEFLDARRSELANRRQAVQLRAALHQATVGLIRALGGGWDDKA